MQVFRRREIRNRSFIRLTKKKEAVKKTEASLYKEGGPLRTSEEPIYGAPQYDKGSAQQFPTRKPFLK